MTEKSLEPSASSDTEHVNIWQSQAAYKRGVLIHMIPRADADVESRWYIIDALDVKVIFNHIAAK